MNRSLPTTWRAARALALALSLALLIPACDHRPSTTAADSAPPPAAPPADEAPATQRTVINGVKFDLELALTDSQRYKGFSDRPSISEQGGMIFAFPKPTEVSFVMRRCLVPIDIIYLNEKGEIVSMYEMQVEPYGDDSLRTYPSHHPIIVAIEFKGGAIERLGLRRGDKIDLPYADLKSRAK